MDPSGKGTLEIEDILFPLCYSYYSLIQILVCVFNTYVLALLWHFWKQSSINYFFWKSGKMERSRAGESKFETSHALCVLVDSSMYSFL